MPTDLPGGQTEENLPPLPKATRDVTQPAVPASWDDITRVSAAVFDYLQSKGKPAADALLAFIKKSRASRPPTS